MEINFFLKPVKHCLVFKHTTFFKKVLDCVCVGEGGVGGGGGVVLCCVRVCVYVCVCVCVCVSVCL